MSNLSTAELMKEALGWREYSPRCENCQYCYSKVKQKLDYTVEVEDRCGIGDFVTQKSSWCASHKFLKGL